MNFVPVFKSRHGDVNLLEFSSGCGSLFVISGALIQKINEYPNNVFGRGLSYVYSEIENGEGDFLRSDFYPIYYDFYKTIICSNTETSSYTVVKNRTESFSVLKQNKVTAIYVSDVLVADEDFGFWKAISWTQSINNAKIKVAVKVAESEETLLISDWQYYISEQGEITYDSPSTEHEVSKSLDRFNLKGNYFQFKVELETEDSFSNPYVGSFVISYASKNSVFFFTRKFKIERNTNIDTIILTASYSEPDNTEIKFGITNQNSIDWGKYKIIDINKLVKLPESYGNVFKVGIKMSSNSSISYPVVQEFGFIIGSESDNRLNQE